MQQGHLRWKRKKKKSVIKPSSRFVALYGAESIHDREAILKRQENIGHWEGDSMIGKGHSGNLITRTERLASYTLIGTVPNKTAQAATNEIVRLLSNEIKNHKIHSLAFDQGSEFFNNHDLKYFLKCKIYKADAGHPEQRGLNENTNGLIRQYFPKSMRCKNLDQKRVTEVTELLNHRPR